MVNESLHKRVYESIKSMIITKLEPYEKLPSERNLALAYHVSRNTVRTAMSELFSNQYIFRIKGLGTFVAERPNRKIAHNANLNVIRECLESSVGFQEQIDSFNIVGDQDALTNMNLNLLEKLLCVARSFISEKEKIRITWDYIPSKFAPDLKEANVYQTSTMRRIIETSRNVPVTSVKVSISAHLATSEEMHLFNIYEPVVLMTLEKISLDTNGKGVLYRKTVVKADRFVFRMSQST
ncbi:GntR family transcriptional regulator [Lacticaseibacillus zeae]|nr:GntR family transcriptional regulator [Lacticaseibacillus zeae]